MKKLVLVLFAIVVIIGLVSCDGTTPVSTTYPEPSAYPAPVEPVKREGTFYFLAANNSSPFYVPGVKGFNDAGELVGMKTEFVGPMDLNVTSQAQTFEELIASPNTAGIFWYPIDFNVGMPLVKEAVEKGIPVVIGAADAPQKDRNAFIGYDNTVLGTQAGIYVAKVTGCQGTVGAISNVQESTKERIEGMMNYLKANCPDMKFVERATHDGSAANEAAVVEAYLVANPDLTLFWFADGDASNLVQLWKEKQDLGVKTMFLAMDMPPVTVQAVKDGIFIGSVGQDTYTEEFWGVLLLDALDKGLRVPDTLYLSAIIVTKENADKYLNP
jgi:ribose transport system substrate-binding protein